MSRAEAIGKLGEFHNATDDSVLDAFMNLRNSKDGTVEFRESVNNGTPCIVMEGKDSEGKFAWNHLIDKYTGQPMVHCS